MKEVSGEVHVQLRFSRDISKYNADGVLLNENDEENDEEKGNPDDEEDEGYHYRYLLIER